MFASKFCLTRTSFTSVRTFYNSQSLWWNVPKYAELNIDFICDPQNLVNIEENIAQRKGVGNIKLVNELKHKLDKIDPLESGYEEIKKEFYEELFQIPNNTHPVVLNFGDDPKFHEITKRLNLVRTEQLGNVSGSKSYYVLGEMAELEQSLVNYFTEKLMEKHFELVSVPDILHRDVIESCGMNTKGKRTQVYSLDPLLHEPDLCLSGTSEIALAGLLTHKVFSESDLPLKFMAISRCFRAETSSIAEERGIFRVHEFTKVEMFVVSSPEKSDETLEEIRGIQEENFASLGLHFQVLDMPAHELGAQAYRKYDVEAWLPGREIYGEISSCSNCTDYQSRRLGIKYKNADGQLHFVHTLNGTACAIPRLLIALTETGQNSNGSISIPEVLQKYMNGKSLISRQKNVPELKLIKYKKYCKVCLQCNIYEITLFL